VLTSAPFEQRKTLLHLFIKRITMNESKKIETIELSNRAEERAKVKATLEKELAEQDSSKRIRHDLELLDEVIQKGFDTLSKMEVIRVKNDLIISISLIDITSVRTVLI
jgi:hypothetical protein